MSSSFVWTALNRSGRTRGGGGGGITFFFSAIAVSFVACSSSVSGISVPNDIDGAAALEAAELEDERLFGRGGGGGGIILPGPSTAPTIDGGASSSNI